jgi:hypothetical protein
LTRGEFGYKICICDSASRRCPCQRLKLSILFIYAIHMFLWDLFTCFRRDSEVYLIANHKAIQPCLIPFVTLITCTEHLIYGFKNISHLLSSCTLKPLLYMWFSSPFFPVVSILTETRRALNLTHGSSTLVLELGVEEIAAADGGDVEACLLERCCQFSWFFSLFSFSLSVLRFQGYCV